jgi:hypothetical protein
MDPRIVEELSGRILSIASEVLGDSLQAVIVKGSAINGDFIPDFSDFDVHIFAHDNSMRGLMTPTSQVALAFQERFSYIDVPAYRVSQIQVFFISATKHPDDWVPPLPGTYRLIHGVLPNTLPELEPDVLRRLARQGLLRCDHWVDTLLGRMLDKPDDKLGDTVRLTGTILKAALYEAAITIGSDPFQTWLAPLGDVLDVVEPELMPSRPATRYYARAWRWAEIQHNGPELRAMARHGIDALDALGEFGCDHSSVAPGSRTG